MSKHRATCVSFMASLPTKKSKQTSLAQFFKSTTNDDAVPSTSAEASKRQALKGWEMSQQKKLGKVSNQNGKINFGG